MHPWGLYQTVAAKAAAAVWDGYSVCSEEIWLTIVRCLNYTSSVILRESIKFKKAITAAAINTA